MFDDVEEATAVSKEVHTVFFQQFIKFGSTTLYENILYFQQTLKKQSGIRNGLQLLAHLEH